MPKLQETFKGKRLFFLFSVMVMWDSLRTPWDTAVSHREEEKSTARAAQTYIIHHTHFMNSPGTPSYDIKKYNARLLYLELLKLEVGLDVGEELAVCAETFLVARPLSGEPEEVFERCADFDEDFFLFSRGDLRHINTQVSNKTSPNTLGH